MASRIGYPLTISVLTYTALTLLMGREVLGDLSTRIAGDRIDPLLNAGILAWSASHAPWTEAWFDFPIFYPVEGGMTFSEHLLGLAMLAAPIHWLTGNALIAYNVTFLATYVLCGVGMFCLVWGLTRHPAASFLAGLAYAFAPYRASQVGHIQTLAAFWAPVALLGLHMFLSTGRRTWLVLFGVAWTLQGAANGYLLVYFSVLVGFWVLWFALIGRRWREALSIVLAMLVAVIPLVPVLLRYVDVHARFALTRTVDEIVFFSADITAVLCADTKLSVWGWLSAGVCGGEGNLFPGAALVVVCALAAVVNARQRNDRRQAEPGTIATFYLAMAAVTWVFSWGPWPSMFGERVVDRGPYALLMLLPGVDGLRVPARFWVVTVLCLCAASGVLLAAALRHWGIVVRRIVIVTAGIGLLMDGWATVPAAGLLPGAPRPDLVRGGTALTLPLGAYQDRDVGSQFEAVTGGWVSVNGYSGYEAPHYQVLREASKNAHLAVLSPFLARGDLNVILFESWPEQDALIESVPGSRLVATGNGLRQYRLPQQGSLPPSEPSGERLNIAALSVSCLPEDVDAVLDGDSSTRWQCGSQSGSQEITADLGRVAMVGDVVPAIGTFSTDYPRALLVETSLDGKVWAGARNGDVRAEVFEALVKDPRLARIVLSFPPRQARYVRLRVAEGSEVPWSIAELEVWSGERR
jgi:hypothetical protein